MDHKKTENDVSKPPRHKLNKTDKRLLDTLVA
ncbi:hypothetical protein AC05_5330, partial [Escherichia coli 3-267-03_S3_C1]